MSAKQGNGRDKLNIKRITVYALISALCLIVGYLETLLSSAVTAAVPGVKLGLSNAAVLTLVCLGDKKGAWAVNAVRICLSALLFGSPVSFVMSAAGGAASTAAACLLSRIKQVSEIGISIACGVIHNIFQIAAAILLVGIGAVYYLPLLTVAGALCGGFCGVLVKLILKKIKTNRMF